MRFLPAFFIKKSKKVPMPSGYKFQGYLDFPLHNKRSYVVSGWYLAKKDFHKVAIFLGNKEVCEVKRTITRKDVVKALKAKGVKYPQIGKGGFEYVIPSEILAKHLGGRNEKPAEVAIRFYVNKDEYAEKFSTRFILSASVCDHDIKDEQNELSSLSEDAYSPKEGLDVSDETKSNAGHEVGVSIEQYRKFYSKIYSPVVFNEKMSDIAFTIASKNRIYDALTLRGSFLKNNPQYRFIIVIMDMLDNKEDVMIMEKLIAKNVDIMFFNEIRNEVDINCLEGMLFKYNVLEMNTAIKPFVFEYFIRKGCRKIIYFDPDVYFLSSVGKLSDLLENHDIILTPHILEPYTDEKMPNELDILMAGTFNLGFIAIKNTENTLNFCRWWEEKLVDNCFIDRHNGMEVDQKWIDLVPSFFKKVHVLKDRGYNVAYWNLHERRIYRKNGEWYANKDKLVFFHFSGLNYDDPETISKHTNRYFLSSLPEMSELFKKYIDEMIVNGLRIFEGKGYYFSHIPMTAIEIPDFLRKRSYEYVLNEVPNPYKADKNNIRRLIDTLTKDVYGDGLISKVGSCIWDSSLELQKYFPDLNYGSIRKQYHDWLVSNAKKEFGVDGLLAKVGSDAKQQQVIPVDSNGMNILGHFSCIIGVAEVARSFVKRSYKSGIPYALFDFPEPSHCKMFSNEIEEFEKYYSEDPAFQKNIFFVNADQVPIVHEHYPFLFEKKYNAAVWWWEFEDYFDFPDAFKYVDEVIVFTDFIRTAVKKAAPKRVQVTKMRYPFVKDWHVKEVPHETRKKLGLENRDFVFMFNFDFHSSYERKNPEAIIKAFSKAFSGKKDVKLVLKTFPAELNPSYKYKLQQLISLIGKYRLENNIILINKPYTMDDLMALINMSDCYISLHRGEGFGLGLFRAMFCGKPVIGTRYGGNMDFMNPDNSLLIDYTKVGVKETIGVYQKGWLWAEPDIDDAAKNMLKLYHNRDLGIKIGNKAKISSQDYCNANNITQELYKFILRT